MVNRNSLNRGADASASSSLASMPQPWMQAPFDVTAVLEASRPTLAAAAEMNGRLYEQVAALNSACVSFLNLRLKEDMSVPQQIASCRTLEDIYGVYTRFFQRAAEQYQAEVEQLAKLSQTITNDAVTQMKDQANGNRRDLR